MLRPAGQDSDRTKSNWHSPGRTRPPCGLFVEPSDLFGFSWQRRINFRNIFNQARDERHGKFRLELPPTWLKDMCQNARVSCGSWSGSQNGNQCEEGNLSKRRRFETGRQGKRATSRQGEKTSGCGSEKRHSHRRRAVEIDFGADRKPASTHTACWENHGRGLQRRNVHRSLWLIAHE